MYQKKRKTFWGLQSKKIEFKILSYSILSTFWMKSFSKNRVNSGPGANIFFFFTSTTHQQYWPYQNLVRIEQKHHKGTMIFVFRLSSSNSMSSILLSVTIFVKKKTITKFLIFVYKNDFELHSYLFYFRYKARFFRTYLLFADNNHPRGENNNQVLANDNNNPEPDRPEVIERRARIEEANNDTNESDNPVATQTNNNENEVQRPGLLSFTWIFFSSFFASLIPDVADVV